MGVGVGGGRGRGGVDSTRAARLGAPTGPVGPVSRAFSFR